MPTIISNKKAEKRKKAKNENNDLVELVPLKSISRSGNILKDDGTFISFLKITTRNINGLSRDEQHRVMSQFENMLRVFEAELSILAMMFPSNIDQNLNYWNKQLLLARKSGNQVRFKTIREQISRLIWVEKELSNLEFYFMTYGKTEKDINTAKQILKRAGGNTLGIKDIPPAQVERILYKLNNLNTPL